MGLANFPFSLQLIIFPFAFFSQTSQVVQGLSFAALCLTLLYTLQARLPAQRNICFTEPSHITDL